MTLTPKPDCGPDPDPDPDPDADPLLALDLDVIDARPTVLMARTLTLTLTLNPDHDPDPGATDGADGAECGRAAARSRGRPWQLDTPPQPMSQPSPRAGHAILDRATQADSCDRAAPSLVTRASPPATSIR